MKKFLPYILIGVVIVNSTLLFIYPNPVEAQETASVEAPSLWQSILMGLGPVGMLVGGAIGGGGKLVEMTIGKALAWLSEAAFQIAGVFLRISGWLLDYSVDRAVKGESIRISAIESGWVICRDVANLFFIFIILFIAIATILRYSTYGMKSLLAKVILIALLVNFSLVISRFIIDASNILAGEFYNKLEIQVELNGKKTTTNSISTVFMDALKLQTIFDSEKIKGETAELEPFDITLIFLGGTIVVLVATFVFFAGAILLLIRSVFLIILMILAPLAFLAMILPGTKQYWDKWLNTLFKQSFLFPVFMFFIYLSAKIISDAKFAKIVEIKDGSSFATAFRGDISSFGIIFNFVVVIILLIFSLIAAQQMGAYGAGAVQKWGKDLKGAAQGYAGRVSKRYAGRAAAAAEVRLETGGRVAGALKKIPFLQRVLAAGAQLKKKEVKAYEKKYAEYYDEETKGRTLEQLKERVGITREAREAIETILKKKRKQEKRKREIEELDKIIAGGNTTEGLNAALKKRELLQTEREEQFEEKEKEVTEKEEALKGKEAKPEKKEEPKKEEPEKPI